jgi:hypothetical protein
MPYPNSIYVIFNRERSKKAVIYLVYQLKIITQTITYLSEPRYSISQVNIIEERTRKILLNIITKQHLDDTRNAIRYVSAFKDRKAHLP